MQIHKAKVHAARGHTDNSLRQERDKTDELLNNVVPEAALATDAALQQTRLDNDAALAAARRETDRALRAPAAPGAVGNAQLRATVDDIVSDDRRQVDEALVLERNVRDAALAVDGERAETDNGLQLERHRVDEAADFAGACLIDEQTALGLAKIAIQRRDEFAGLVTHELRNPLTSISMNADWLAETAVAGPAGDDARQAATEIKDACGRMATLIADLMDVASLETGRLRVTVTRGDVVAVVQDAAAASAPALGKSGLTLVVDLPPGPIEAPFDRSRLRQVLGNLLDNAAKFTPAGGQVTVGLTATDDEIRLFVRDTGVGIKAADAAHVFERFWQLGKSDRRGLGLGLYICKAIAASHGGTMWLESAPGAGATFYFTLPTGILG